MVNKVILSSTDVGALAMLHCPTEHHRRSFCQVCLVNIFICYTDFLQMITFLIFSLLIFDCIGYLVAVRSRTSDIAALFVFCQAILSCLTHCTCSSSSTHPLCVNRFTVAASFLHLHMWMQNASDTINPGDVHKRFCVPADNSHQSC